MGKVDFIKSKNKFFLSFLPIIGLLFLIFVFFIKLFYPYPKIFFTPDVYLSDLIHLNYSLKYLLSQSLQKNELPWWEPRVGSGYPIIAESQIGAFFLPNLIAFRFLPFSSGFRLIFPLTFFITGLGIYFLFNHFNKSKLASFFGSVFFIFSIPYATQIIHLNLIQAFSFFPWYFLAVLRWREKQKKIWFYLQLFFLSQIFFAGHFQIFFISILLVFFYSLLIYDFKTAVFFHLKSILFLIPVITIQLFPTFEFAINSIREKGISHFMPYGDFPWYSLLTYFNFLALDNLGQFPNFPTKINFFNQITNLVWETNLYTGFFPLIFAGYFLVKNHREKINRAIISIILISIFLSFGTKSPLFFIFFLPIFNFFRTSFRFSFFTNFFIILSFSLSLSYFFKLKFSAIKKIIFIFFLMIDLSFLFFLSYQLHPLINEKKLTQSSEINKIIPSDKSIFQAGFELIWNKIMMDYGYQRIDNYLFLLKNSLYPYFNLLENKKSAGIFFPSLFHPKYIFLKNIFLINELYEPIQSEIENNYSTSFSEISLPELIKITKKPLILEKKGTRLLQLIGVDYLISPFLYKDTDGIKRVKTINYPPLSMNIYQIKKLNDEIFLGNEFQFIESMDDLFYQLQKNDSNIIFFKKDEKFVRQFFSSKCNLNKNKIINYQVINQMKIKITTENDCPTVLVLKNSHYPGWQALINGIKTKIYRVNISQKAVLLPSGKNEIVIEYKPWWLSFFYLSIFFNIALFIRLISWFFLKDSDMFF